MITNEILLDTNSFIKVFEDTWVNKFKNSSSIPLRQCWHNLSDAFNKCITSNMQEKEPKKVVVPLPTGCGKTEGLIQYLKLLDNTTTALIVVPFIEDADYIEREINKEYKGKAIAYHSKNDVNIHEIEFTQILIVTHQHFLKNHDKEHLNHYLIVIDEALDVMTEYTIDKMSLQRLQIICNHLNAKYKILNEDKKTIDKLLQLMLELQTKSKENKQNEKLLFHESFYNDYFQEVKENGSFDFENLRSGIKDTNCTKILTGIYSSENEQETKESLFHILDSIKHIIGEWQYFINTGKNPSIHSASFIEFDKSVVILDATATTNKLYELADDVELYPTVDGARNYKNVKCHISKGHNTGKSNLIGDDELKAKESVNNLLSTMGEINSFTEDSKVLVVTHKALKSHLLGYDLPFHYDVTNWGAITGKNDWNDYTDIIIFGLNHKPKQFTINRHSIVTNPVNAFRNNDERVSIKNTDIIAETIQAINRVRCRKVVDSQGNCEDTNIFILLPNGTLTEQFEESIQKQMIGINLVDWTYNHQKRKSSVKRSSYLEAVIAYVLNHESKSIKGSNVKHALDIPDSSFKDLVKSEAFKKELEINKLTYQLPPTTKRGKFFYKCNM